jgi:cytoskeletal protein RodZ
MRQIGEHTVEMNKTYSHRLSRVSGLVAAAGLFAVVVGGYLYYQNSDGADASAELQKPPSPGAASASASAAGTTADAASNVNSQRVAAVANAPAAPAANQGSPAPSPSANRAPELPARVAVSAQSKPISLSTNDFAYVQKSSANLRSTPSVRAKRVGQAPRGAKLNIVRRTGKWVQVESGATKGWVSGNLLGPRSP